MKDRGTSLTIENYRRLAEFRHQIRRFLSFSTQAARAAGLEPRQHQLLLALKGLPPEFEPSVGQLAQRLQIRHNTAVELVNRLEDRGLVERHRSGDDRRKVLVTISDEGESVLAELSRHHLQELRTIGPDLVEMLGELIGDRSKTGVPREK